MIDARMKIRHLQCFMEVARLGHVGRAADQLAVTQPAVSKTLRELEELLNVRLFTRGPKGLALTPLGEAFQHYAATGVVALQQAIDSVAQGKLQGDSNIKIGALPTVAVRLMPQAVRALTAQRRDAAVHLITGPNRILLERLKSRELDVVVGRLADPDQMIGLAFEQLYLERMAVVVHPRHPLVGERAARPPAHRGVRGADAQPRGHHAPDRRPAADRQRHRRPGAADRDGLERLQPRLPQADRRRSGSSPMASRRSTSPPATWSSCRWTSPPRWGRSA